MQDMVKSFVTVVATGALLALSGCGLGDGSVDGCATALYGTFEGSDDGPGVVSGFLSIDGETAEGRLDLVFLEADDTPDDLSDNTDRDASARVNPNGELTLLSAGALKVTGSMNLDTCKASGDWDLFDGNEVGTWEIGRYEAAGF